MKARVSLVKALKKRLHKKLSIGQQEKLKDYSTNINNIKYKAKILSNIPLKLTML